MPSWSRGLPPALAGSYRYMTGSLSQPAFFAMRCVTPLDGSGAPQNALPHILKVIVVRIVSTRSAISAGHGEKTQFNYLLDMLLHCAFCRGRISLGDRFVNNLMAGQAFKSPGVSFCLLARARSKSGPFRKDRSRGTGRYSRHNALYEVQSQYLLLHQVVPGR